MWTDWLERILRLRERDAEEALVDEHLAAERAPTSMIAERANERPLHHPDKGRRVEPAERGSGVL